MKVCVIGNGYVGLVTGGCFSDLGNDVIGVDIDAKKVEELNRGILPIYEPGLKEIFLRNLKEDRLKFTTDFKEGITRSDIIFIAVGTPEGADHRADLSAVLSVAGMIGKHINGYKVVVNKSTVPVGTAELVRKAISESNKSEHEFDVVSNPEFLREGTAIRDFTRPDRIVIGTSSERSKKMMEQLYKGIARVDQPIMFTDTKSAEIIKYASNSMLATRISFMNMLSHLCEKKGGDIKEVAKGIGLDKRIGSRFLQAGIGYGGSCFPKDVNALIMTLKDSGCNAGILEAVHETNEKQKTVIMDKISEVIPDLKGKTVAVLGLAFKPKTDDIREAPSLRIIEALQSKGAKVVAFDPVAEDNARKIHEDIEFASNPYNALDGADCLILCTEWDEFRNLDREKMRRLMKNPIIFDGRNVYDPQDMSGFTYIGIGRGRR